MASKTKEKAKTNIEELEKILSNYPEYIKVLLPAIFSVEREYLNIKSLSRGQTDEIQKKIMQLVQGRKS